MLVVFVLAEMVLRYLLPLPVTEEYSDRTPKAKWYGWAPPCNTELRSISPDDGSVSTYRMNSQCWRDVEHQFEKPDSVTRLLFLGDSNTFGVVHFDDLYTRQVERLLSKGGMRDIEVISIGVGGWGTDHVLEALLNEGLRYDPDVVIYQFCGNDITDNTASFVHYDKVVRYELREGELTRVVLGGSKRGIRSRVKAFLAPREIAHALRRLRGLIHNLSGGVGDIKYEGKRTIHWWEDYPLDPTSPYNWRIPLNQSQYMRDAWALFDALLARIKVVTENAGAQFIVLSEEGEQGKRHWHLRWNRILNDGMGDYVLWEGKRYPIDWKLPLRNLSEVCRRHRIPLIEPKRVYERYVYDPHPNAVGNLAMAQDIVDFLADSVFVMW